MGKGDLTRSEKARVQKYRGKYGGTFENAIHALGLNKKVKGTSPKKK